MSGAFIVEEITSRDGLNRVVLRLEGRNLPEGGKGSGGAFTVSPKSRQTAHRYPGVDKPTRHLLGVDYDALSVKGVVRDRHNTPGFALAFKRTVELLANRPVRVSWGDQIAYEGVLDKGECSFETEHDVVYSLTFEIDGPVDAPRPQQAAETPATVGDLSASSHAARTALAATADEAPRLLSAADTEALLGALTILDLAADALDAALASETDAAALDPAANRRAAACAGSLAAASRLVASTVGTMPIPDRRGLDAARWQRLRAESLEAVAALEIAAVATQARLDEIAAEGTRAELYEVHGGDTLESIALARLGDAGRAGAIARNNRLAGFSVEPGQTLSLPR